MTGTHDKCVNCLAIYEVVNGHDCPLHVAADVAAQAAYGDRMIARAQAMAVAMYNRQAEQGFAGAQFQGEHGLIRVDTGPVRVAPPLSPEERTKALGDAAAAIEDVMKRIQQAHDDFDRARANRLADECGKLRDENRELLTENAVLRRRVEKLERKS